MTENLINKYLGESNLDKYQKHIDDKLNTDAYMDRLEDFIQFVTSVYIGAGLLKKNIAGLRPNQREIFRKKHKEAVEKAIKSGKKIPMDVFKDYPDLKKKYQG